jgi:hypothetical protein
VHESLKHIDLPIPPTSRGIWEEKLVEILSDLCLKAEYTPLKTHFKNLVLVPMSCLFNYCGYKVKNEEIEKAVSEAKQQLPQNDTEALALLNKLTVMLLKMNCFSDGKLIGIANGLEQVRIILLSGGVVAFSAQPANDWNDTYGCSVQ